MTRTKLTSANSVTNASTFQTASIAPTSNVLVLVFVVNSRAGALTAPAIPTVVGINTQWVLVQTITAGKQNSQRLSCFRSVANAPGQGVITFTFDGENQDFCAWSVFQYDGVDTSGIAGSNAVVHSTTAHDDGDVTSLVATLPLAADPSRNTAVGALLLTTRADEAHPLQPGAGMTKVDEQDVNQFLGRGATLQTEDAAPARSDVMWTWDNPGPAAAIALEVAATPTATTPGGPTSPSVPVPELITRFAPVLSFHPEEVFFPVDAKRYLEHAALWNARAGFDATGDWGGLPTDPFPRKPTVASGSLAGIKGEPGTDFIGDPKFVLAGSNEELFLELGGWKDHNETHEQDVTSSSANSYADRNAIFMRYHNEPALAESQFWYHAEAFDFDRLKAIVGRTGNVDLLPLLNRLKDPVLLCYYLFFPAHEQGVGAGDCMNIEAKEIACHAGDWQCFALLLQGDGTGTLGTFSPVFYGITGIRPPPDSAGIVRPNQIDTEDRTVMKVEAWRPSSGPTANQPQVEEFDHAHFFVARGSHSLYPVDGDHEVDSDALAGAADCGRLDIPGLPAVDDWPASGWAKSGAFWAKIIEGGLFGAIGALAGVVAAAAELKYWLDNSSEAAPPASPPNPDQGPGPSQPAGITVRPSGVDVAGGVPADKLVNWRVQQGLLIDGRSYDFIVDRSAQKWWPSEDRTSGYQGRWGQRVSLDSFARRAGPKFPDFAGMFLMALADGDHRSLLKLNL